MLRIEETSYETMIIAGILVSILAVFLLVGLYFKISGRKMTWQKTPSQNEDGQFQSDKFFQFFLRLTLFILIEKNCPTIPSWTLNVFYLLVIQTDDAQVSFVLIALCQSGGAAINFSKSPRNQNRTTLLL